jgi:hypothetical protein
VIVRGLNSRRADAIVIMMADESNDSRDTIRSWELLNAGWDCVFGSRYLSIMRVSWLKKFFCRRDYRKKIRKHTSAPKHATIPSEKKLCSPALQKLGSIIHY